MKPGTEQFDAVARWLDGQAVELTAQEKALAEELQANERQVGPLLEAPMDAAVLEHVRQRLRNRRVVWRRVVQLRYVASAAASAAAVLLVALTLNPGRPNQAPAPQAAEAATPAPGFSAQEEELVLLARDLDALEAEMTIRRTPTVANDIDSLQSDINNFWSEETPG